MASSAGTRDARDGAWLPLELSEVLLKLVERFELHSHQKVSPINAHLIEDTANLDVIQVCIQCSISNGYFIKDPAMDCNS